MLQKLMLIICFMIFLFINACSYAVKSRGHFEIRDMDQIIPIPIKVGLYMPSDVCGYKIIKEREGMTFLFGEAICDGVERMLSGVFNEVIIIESIDSDLGKYGAKAIVVPQIMEGNVLLPATKLQPFKMVIRIKYTAIDTNKKTLWVDTFQGEGRKIFDKSFIFACCLPPAVIALSREQEKEDMREGMDLVLKDHFSNALAGMVLSKWWESIQ